VTTCFLPAYLELRLEALRDQTSWAKPSFVGSRAGRDAHWLLTQSLSSLLQHELQLIFFPLYKKVSRQEVLFGRLWFGKWKESDGEVLLGWGQAPSDPL
jgi:hypothetical protein